MRKVLVGVNYSNTESLQINGSRVISNNGNSLEFINISNIWYLLVILIKYVLANIKCRLIYLYF